jgi:lysozyme
VAAAGVSFAFAKASDGASLSDPKFSANWPAMKASGIIRGAYHFFRPNDDPAAQVDLFVNTVMFEPGDLPPVLDVEKPPKSPPLDPSILPRLQQWLDGVEQATGRRPMIYTNGDSWRTQLKNPLGFTNYPLWIARYSLSPPAPGLGGWAKWTFWQYSDAGTVTGVNGNVDVDTFNGDLDTLQSFVSAQIPGGTSAPTLQQGSTGPAVKELQQRLSDQGFDPGPIDGAFGPQTKAAVMAFQTANGLTADGIVGPKTRAALGLS